MRFDVDQPIPSLAIRFRHAGLLVAAHEVDVNAWRHRRPQLGEQTAHPRDVCGILRGLTSFPAGSQ